MEDCNDLKDWEMIPGSNLSLSENLKSVDEETENGTINDDYFALDSGGRPQIPSEEEGADAGNDSDPRFLETSRGKLSFVEEKAEVGNLVDSAMEADFEETDARCENLEGGSENSGAPEMMPVVCGADSCGGEKRENVWWKMPLELLQFCILRVRPAWSISIAATIVGIVMLGRKLYRMKHKSRIIPLRIAIDDKKASQFVARSARLKAISLVRYMPLIRPSLPASGATQWAALPQR